MTRCSDVINVTPNVATKVFPAFSFSVFNSTPFPFRSFMSRSLFFKRSFLSWWGVLCAMDVFFFDVKNH